MSRLPPKIIKDDARRLLEVVLEKGLEIREIEYEGGRLIIRTGPPETPVVDARTGRGLQVAP